MDQREFHLQHVGICNRLYHFLTKVLASQALKTVTLGHSKRQSSSSTAIRGSGQVEDKKLPPTQPLVGDSISKPCKNVDENKGENVASTLPTASLAPMPSIKKTVSINENVEEIPPPKKLKKKWSKSFQKSFSQDQDEEPSTPPRSILKVPSDLNDKSNSIS
ncbi:uncharacterized protein LOC109787697 [Cajanus cajan]|uniref:Uncharacterized protein n=1 Tax=Cajanus cajan TaxID=3821 RepID=A0A151U501_CAJCA|nr:uncharacterized protein LOC109787697 [Cajanus cajan]KYP74399.1 hypothetical protein KK1_007077 [Cajanus cajan]